MELYCAARTRNNSFFSIFLNYIFNQALKEIS